jgi:hypothetical protein
MKTSFLMHSLLQEFEKFVMNKRNYAQQKLTSSILVATRHNENKFSSALAAPRIREIREIRG